MKCNNNFYVNIKRFSVIWLFPGKSLYNIPTQPFSTTCKHHYKIINQGMENLWHMSCLKCHVHNKRTRFKRVYLGIGSLVCIINLLVAPVGNLLMRLGWNFFQTWKLSLWKPNLCLVIHSYSDKLVFRRVQYFII